MNTNEMLDVNEVIYRIGYIRNRAKLTARALSIKIGKTESYINRMEQGGFEPSLSALLDIIKVCGSTTEEFFSANIQEFAKTKKLLSKIDKMPEQEKDYLLS